MSTARRRLFILPGFLAIAISSGLLAAPQRELPMQPGASPPPPAELEGHARSYYLYCRAQEAVLRRDYVTARDLLSRAAAVDPDSALLWTELARTHLGLRDNDEALEAASRATELDPESVEPRRIILDLHTARLRQEEPVSEEAFNRAVEAHLKLLAVDPSDESARVSLGRIYFDRGFFMQAAEILRPYVTANPAALEAAYILSQALTNSGDLAGARSVLEETVRVDPENPELQLALVEVLEASGETDGALTILEGLVQGHPQRSAYRFVLAQIYQRHGRHEAAARQAKILTEALASARSGSSQEAGLRAAFMLLIDTSALAGNVECALGSAVLAERRFPDDPRFPLKRAELFLVEGRDEDAAAIFHALEGHPQSPGDGALSMVYLRAGAHKEREGDLERAEKLLREAVARNPENHGAMNYLGYMMADMNVSLDEARDLIERALSLDADNGAYLDSLGWVLFRLGRYVDAETPLRRAASIIPEEPVVHDHLGDLYWAQGRREEAVGAWREAIRLGIERPARLQEKINRSASADAPAR